MDGWCVGGYQKTKDKQLVDGCQEQSCLEEDHEEDFDPFWVVELDVMMMMMVSKC